MTIVYILAAVFVGWMIGYFDSNIRTSKKIKAAEAKAKIAISEVEKKILEAQAQVKSDAPATISEPPGPLGLKNVNGVPFLELDGVLLNVRTISADQKKRLFELLMFIHSWVESGQSLPPAQKPGAPIGLQSRTPPFYSAAPASGADAVSPLPGAISGEAKDPQPLSAIAQIDAILQSRLANSPLAGRGICLTQRTTSGGVQVHVGTHKYPTLADVPDQQIKTIVRAAIAEWEEKHMPVLKPAATVNAQPPASAVGVTFTKPPPPAKPADEREFRSLSIVAQIDTVLQARLEDSPLADKGIRLIERTALGGVEVYVGHQKYPSLDDVPDQQIKTAIRAAIAEWEKKYTPGM
jgi:hypothetical protein